MDSGGRLSSFPFVLCSFCWRFSSIRGRTTRRSAGYRATWCGWPARAWRSGARRGLTPSSVCFFVSNHVNLFDPFVLYSAMPQFIRGLELESHFRIPVYGWLMKRFGNVPVPDVNRPSDLKRMWRLTRAALDSGVSLVVFPEGSRTITGRVGRFTMACSAWPRISERPSRRSASWARSRSIARRAGCCGRRRSWCTCTTPSKPAGTAKREVPELRERVWRDVAEPVHASMGEAAGTGTASTRQEAKA